MGKPKYAHPYNASPPPARAPRRPRYRMRKYFFGRMGFGMWPIIIAVIAISLNGGIDSMESFAEQALPIVLWTAAISFFIWGVVAFRRWRRGY